MPPARSRSHHLRRVEWRPSRKHVQVLTSHTLAEVIEGLKVRSPWVLGEAEIQ